MDLPWKSFIEHVFLSACPVPAGHILTNESLDTSIAQSQLDTLDGLKTYLLSWSEQSVFVQDA